MLLVLCVHCAGRATVAPRRVTATASEALVRAALDAANVRAATDAGRTPGGATDRPREPDAPSSGVIDFAVGGEDVCVILDDRSVRCRPHEFLMTPEEVSPVTTVAGIPRAHHVDSAGRRVCVRDEAGASWCWGSVHWCDMDIQIEAPQRVPGITPGTEVALPQQGLNDSGTDLQALTPAGAVVSLACPGESMRSTRYGGPVRQLVVGGTTACALLGDATVTCIEVDLPIARVAGLVNAQEVRMGHLQACARQADGAVRCWPVCAQGEISRSNCIGTRARGRVIRTWPVAGVAPLVALATGHGAACGLARDHTVWCWALPGWGVGARRGMAFGTPFQVPGLSDVERIDMESSTLCALRSDRSLWCVADPQPGRRPQQMGW